MPLFTSQLSKARKCLADSLNLLQAGKNLTSLVCATAPSSASNEPGPSSADGDEESAPKTAVEAVLFSASEANQLITGTLEGTVTVWDISTHVS